MSALAKISSGCTVSYVPPQWCRNFEVHTSRLASGPSLPDPHGEPTQRSLPLLRVVRLNLSVSVLPAIQGGSPHPDTQSVPTVSEQPATPAADQITCVVAEVTSLKPTRPARWSEANVGLLRSDYPTLRPVRDISADLGRSVSAIYGKARRLDLKRPKRRAAPTPSAAPPPLPNLFTPPAPHVAEPVSEPSPPVFTPPHIAEPAPAPCLPEVTAPLVAEAAPEFFAYPEVSAPPVAEPAPVPSLCGVSQSPPKQPVKRTKLGGREGRWVCNDGALSVRLERLHLAGFHDSCIAAVLGVTSAAVLTRAWAINCPDRDVTRLRHDVEAARLVDRQAAPLPKTVVALDRKTRTPKTLTRKRCNVKGDFYWGDKHSRYCSDARRLPCFDDLRASAPMHGF